MSPTPSWRSAALDFAESLILRVQVSLHVHRDNTTLTPLDTFTCHGVGIVEIGWRSVLRGSPFHTRIIPHTLII